MRVYADLRWPARSGIGVVQAEMLARLPAGIDIVDLGVKTRIGSPLSPWHLARSLRDLRARSGVFWSAGFMPPASSSVPSVVTVHDLTHLHHYTRLHAIYYQRVLRHLYLKCRNVICVSEYTRREFVEWSGFPAERAVTVYNGVSSALARGRGAKPLPFSYVLYVGNRRPHKNLRRLITGYARSKLPTNGIRLVLTGHPDGELERAAAAAGAPSTLYFAGDPDQEGIASLYGGAHMVAYPSLYEGFGLPILEAMMAGVPVLTSSVTSMPEVAGNAASLVDPTSIEDIVAALDRLAFDAELRQLLVARGYERVERFSWDASAGQVWEIVARAGEV